MAYRVFQIGNRIELRGLVMQGTGTITKIGRKYATVKMDKPRYDYRRKEDREIKTPHAFEYKHLRLI